MKALENAVRTVLDAHPPDAPAAVKVEPVTPATSTLDATVLGTEATKAGDTLVAKGAVIIPSDAAAVVVTAVPAPFSLFRSIVNSGKQLWIAFVAIAGNAILYALIDALLKPGALEALLAKLPLPAWLPPELLPAPLIYAGVRAWGDHLRRPKGGSNP